MWPWVVDVGDGYCWRLWWLWEVAKAMVLAEEVAVAAIAVPATTVVAMNSERMWAFKAGD
jgi:hypothetical protein